MAELYDLQLWLQIFLPTGSFVPRYYEPRRPRGADGGLSGPGAPCSQDEGRLHGNDAGMGRICGRGRDEGQLLCRERQNTLIIS